VVKGKVVQNKTKQKQEHVRMVGIKLKKSVVQCNWSEDVERWNVVLSHGWERAYIWRLEGRP
jgi:hypothetical protein